MLVSQPSVKEGKGFKSQGMHEHIKRMICMLVE